MQISGLLYKLAFTRLCCSNKQPPNHRGLPKEIYFSFIVHVSCGQANGFDLGFLHRQMEYSLSQ